MHPESWLSSSLARRMMSVRLSAAATGGLKPMLLELGK